MELQQAYLPDAFIAVAEELPLTVSTGRARKAVDRSISWLDECLKIHTQPGFYDAVGSKQTPSILACVTGGGAAHERKRCAAEMAKRAVDGFVLGGMYTGESPDVRQAALAETVEILPATKARVVVGPGAPDEILECVASGIDVFHTAYPLTLTEFACAATFEYDPVCLLDADAKSNPPPAVTLPQKRAREEEEAGEGGTSTAATATGRSKICLRDKSYELDTRPLVEGCQCFACQRHTRAYIHHLLNTHEMLAEVLLMSHNVTYYTNFFQAIRTTIADGTFPKYHQAFLQKFYEAGSR